ncbi:hypothetical protein LguiB_004154 [Lonicera macranthoides]
MIHHIIYNNIILKQATYGQINVIQRLIRYSGENCDLQKHSGEGKSLTREEFEKIFHTLILGTGVTGIGMKDLIFYLFGIPATALFLKQRLIPNALPNEVFIPGVTSATVFLLAKLNKI